MHELQKVSLHARFKANSETLLVYLDRLDKIFLCLLYLHNSVEAQACGKCSQIVCAGAADGLAGFSGGPCHVGSDDDIFHSQQRIGRVYRFALDHIDCGSGKLSALDGFCKIGLVYECTSGGVDEESAVLHAADEITVDKSQIFRSCRAVKGNNI